MRTDTQLHDPPPKQSPEPQLRSSQGGSPFLNRPPRGRSSWGHSPTSLTPLGRALRLARTSGYSTQPSSALGATSSRNRRKPPAARCSGRRRQPDTSARHLINFPFGWISWRRPSKPGAPAVPRSARACRLPFFQNWIPWRHQPKFGAPAVPRSARAYRLPSSRTGFLGDIRRSPVLPQSREVPEFAAGGGGLPAAAVCDPTDDGACPILPELDFLATSAEVRRSRSPPTATNCQPVPNQLQDFTSCMQDAIILHSWVGCAT